MLKRLVRHAAYVIAPRLAAQIDLGRAFAENARKLRQRAERLDRLEAIVDELVHSQQFRSNQKRSEILQLLQIVKELRPKRVCEIGAAGGGTLFLFATVAAPDAKLLSVDLCYPLAQRMGYRNLRRDGQKIACMQGDSHSTALTEMAVRWLGGEQLDFLFIDGDHTLEGVRQDFETYAPMVREGGVIALHDIVPDHRTRFGMTTTSYSGGVPVFWEELKHRYANAEEFIEDPSQDGFGIGVLHKGVDGP